MRLSWLFLALCFYSFAVQSNELAIRGPMQVRAYTPYQYKVYHGSTDVTRQVRWSTSRFEARIEIGGKAVFELPSFVSSDSYQVWLRARYQYEGRLLEASRSINVDIRPNFLEITGPYSLRRGSDAQFYAYGTYFLKRVDLTRLGYWSAQYGRITSWGGYTSVASLPSVDRDIITFRFANSWKNTQLVIY